MIKMIRANMAERDWNSLSTECQRELMRKLSILDTEEATYALGTNTISDNWEIHRYIKGSKKYEVVDQWF